MGTPWQYTMAVDGYSVRRLRARECHERVRVSRSLIRRVLQTLHYGRGSAKHPCRSTFMSRTTLFALFEGRPPSATSRHATTRPSRLAPKCRWRSAGPPPLLSSSRSNPSAIAASSIHSARTPARRSKRWKNRLALAIMPRCFAGELPICETDPHCVQWGLWLELKRYSIRGSPSGTTRFSRWRNFRRRTWISAPHPTA